VSDNDQLTAMIAGLASRHVLTVAAGSLVTLGVLHTGNDETQFIQVGSGILVGLLGIGWSWWQKVGQARVRAELAKWKSPAYAPTLAQGEKK
jgi:ABC-type nickel/cobalt efflux system permease component RcnA